MNLFFTGLDPIALGLKATGLLVVTSLMMFFCRRQSSAVRHAIWTYCAVGLLALPVLEVMLPAWRISVLSVTDTTSKAMKEEVAVADGNGDTVAPAAPAVGEFVRDAKWQNSSPAPYSSSAKGSRTMGSDSNGMPGKESAGKAAAPSSDPAEGLAVGDDSRSLSWRAVASAVWISGALLYLTLLVSLMLLRPRFLLREAFRVGADTSLGGQFARARESIGLAEGCRLYVATYQVVPFTCGLFRQAIVLPEDVWRWSDEEIRSVLLHELAHVKRRDCLTQLAGQLACAVYWFHPLAWWMSSRMRLERERACDDLVLKCGALPKAYGETLLSMAARSSGFAAAPFPALAMTRNSTLEGRLLAIMDPARNRRGLTRGVIAWAVAVAALVLVPIASVRLVGEPAASSGGNAGSVEAEASRDAGTGESAVAIGAVAQDGSAKEVQAQIKAGVIKIVNAQRLLRVGDGVTATALIEEVRELGRQLMLSVKGTPYAKRVSTVFGQTDRIISLIQQGRLNDAVDRIQERIEASPTMMSLLDLEEDDSSWERFHRNAGAYLIAAIEDLRVGDSDHAEGYLRQAVHQTSSAYPPNVREAVKEAFHRLMLEDDAVGALTRLESAVGIQIGERARDSSIDPAKQWSYAYFSGVDLIGQAADRLRDGRPAEAERFLKSVKKVGQLLPEDANEGVAKAYRQLAGGDVEGALAALEVMAPQGIGGREPARSEGNNQKEASLTDEQRKRLRVKGQAAFRQAEYRRMFAIYDRLTASGHASVEDHLWHGHAYQLAGRWEGARDAYAGALGAIDRELEEIGRQLAKTEPRPRLARPRHEYELEKKHDRLRRQWPEVVLEVGRIDLEQLDRAEQAAETLAKGLRFAAMAAKPLEQLAADARNGGATGPWRGTDELDMPVFTQRFLAKAYERLGRIEDAMDAWTRVRLCQMAYSAGRDAIDPARIRELWDQLKPERRKPWHRLVLENLDESPSEPRLLDLSSGRVADAFAQEANPFEPWPLKGILFNSVGPSHATLAKRPNGALLMAWTTADKFQIQSRIMLSSSANGKEWETPWAFEHNTIFNTRSPSLLVDDAGTIWMVCLSKRLSTRFRTSAEYDLWLTHSNDGRNWAPLRIIPIPDQPLSAQYQHVAQLVQSPDGRYHIFFNGRITSGETPEALGELRSLNLPPPEGESYSTYPTNLDATFSKDGTCHLVFDDFGQAIYYTRSDDLKRWSPVQKLAEREKGSWVDFPQLIVDGERVALIYEKSSGTWLERGRLPGNRLRLRAPVQITTNHAPLNGSRLFRLDDKVLSPAGVDPYYSLLLTASVGELLSPGVPYR